MNVLTDEAGEIEVEVGSGSGVFVVEVIGVFVAMFVGLGVDVGWV